MERFLVCPQKLVRKVTDMPKVAITMFSSEIFEMFVQRFQMEIITFFESANGKLPIYKFEYQGIKIALYLSRVGAPACVIQFEEVVAMGIERLVMFGSCGAMNMNIKDGEIVIPTGAYSDEGVGEKYISNLVYIDQPLGSYKILEECAAALGYRYMLGKVWTTDGFYRESIEKYVQYKNKGCIAVDMECSAMLAASYALKIQLVVFLYAADVLSSDNWFPRSLNKNGRKYQEKYCNMALHTAVKLSEKNE